MTPKRIQRRRSKGWRMPAGTICVTRPGKWGNPWTVGGAAASGLFRPECCAQVVVDEFRAWLTKGRSPNGEHDGFYREIEIRRRRILADLHELRGKDLACWCPIGSPCHADVLLELANREETP
jgi:hypothetical protein